MKIRLIKTTDAGFADFMTKVLERRGSRTGDVEARVQEIIAAVRQQGDRALFRYTQMFDRVTVTAASVEIKKAAIDQAMSQVAPKDLSTLRFAAKRIAAFHRRQLQKSWHYRDPLGMVLGQRITPLERVGVYVPGGKACYPSTVLMNTIPAKVAGVSEIIMTSPDRGKFCDHSCRGEGCRRRPDFSHRRRAGDCRTGLWHGFGSESRQDRRAGKYFRRDGQTDRIRRSGY